jgi:hypothetical protein|tara:strand:- start:140 stop:2110 length:1971 start_codon:yes stop_codon:yes gene_type:complete
MPNAEYGTSKKIVKKNVKYIGRDFSSIRQNLIEFAKSYYPTAYNDFNESSPGMMFIEMAAYVGDVLSYYADNQFRETLLHAAEEKKNIFKIAQSFGYKPKLSTPSSTIADITIEVPATTEDNENYEPDTNYALKVDADSVFSSKSGRSFRLMDDIDFAVSTSYDNRVEKVSQTDGDIPTHYTLTKKGNLESGFKTSETFTFGDAVKFDKIILGKKNVIDIISCVDDDGNTWYQVPFLAQDTVFKDIENNSVNSPDVSSDKTTAPFLLKLIKTANRFTTYVRSDGKMELRFGAGVSSNADEEIVPNPDNVGSSLGTGLSKLDQSFDPSNFLKTKAFGQAPSNITLTVTYTYGGVQADNVVSGEITNLDSIAFTLNEEGLDATKVQDTKDSLAVFNPEPATGASGAETPEIVRQNAAAYFHAQNRAVTKEDYITRVYSLPQKYGNVAKCFIVQDEQLEQNTQTIMKNGKIKKQPNVTVVPNPLALNFYVLGFDYRKNLIALNDTVKQNLRVYLSQYRILTDAINIKDAYTINIGIRFSIITQRGYNKNEVLLRCIDAVKNHFDIDKWSIGQPIILSDVAYVISLVDGVASVVPPEDDNPQKQMVVVENKFRTSEGYSGHVYDLQSATKDGVIYTSLDPSIFELKFPNLDIEGRVVGDI